MAATLEPWPEWAESALQGVSFWIGHGRALYRHYPLAEAALVAETCNLIHANLPDHYRLICEVQYSLFMRNLKLPPVLGGRNRADLVVAEERKKLNKTKLIPRFVIEVKRAKASTAAIDSDLKRLAAVKRLKPNIRAFLFVISEAYRPTRFVSEEGKSILGVHGIPEIDEHFRVRRTWKAARAYKSTNSANYACLIEVFLP